MLKNIYIVMFILISTVLAAPEAYRDIYLENNALSARALAEGLTGIGVNQNNNDAIFINPAVISNKNNVSLKSETTMVDVSRFAVQGTFALKGAAAAPAPAATTVGTPAQYPTENPAEIFAETTANSVASANISVVTDNISSTVTPAEPVKAASVPAVNNNEAYPAGDGPSVAFGYSNISVTDIPIAELSGTDLVVADKAGYLEQEFFMGLAAPLTAGLRGGLVAKYFNYSLQVDEKIYERGNATGGDLDLGLLWQLADFDLGLGYRNVLSALSKDGVLNWDTGVRSSFDHGLFAGLHKQCSEKIGLNLDVFNSRLHTLVYGVGLEYQIVPQLKLRGGYNSIQKFSAGLGLALNDQFIFDYAYLPDFGSSADNKHFFTLGYLF